jgi:hypothetical protein
VKAYRTSYWMSVVAASPTGSGATAPSLAAAAVATIAPGTAMEREGSKHTLAEDVVV